LVYYDSWYHAAPELHKSMGMLLLFALMFRFIWRWLNIRPTLRGANWEKFVALLVHRLHYALLFLLMLTGYLIPTAEGVGIDVFGWFTVPALMSFDKDMADLVGAIHKYTAWAVIGLAGIHTAAALKHHFVDKDDILLRMLGISRK